MSIELRESVSRVVAQKKSTGYREPDIPYHVGVAHVPGEVLQTNQLQLSLGAVDSGFVEGDGITNAGVEQLVIIGEVSDVPSVDVYVGAHPVAKRLRHAAF